MQNEVVRLYLTSQLRGKIVIAVKEMGFQVDLKGNVQASSDLVTKLTSEPLRRQLPLLRPKNAVGYIGKTAAVLVNVEFPGYRDIHNVLREAYNIQ